MLKILYGFIKISIVIDKPNEFRASARLKNKLPINIVKHIIPERRIEPEKPATADINTTITINRPR